MIKKSVEKHKDHNKCIENNEIGRNYTKTYQIKRKA